MFANYQRALKLLLPCPSHFVFIGDGSDKDMVKNALYSSP